MHIWTWSNSKSYGFSNLLCIWLVAAALKSPQPNSGQRCAASSAVVTVFGHKRSSLDWTIRILHILFTFLAKKSFFTIFRGAPGHQFWGAAETPVFGTMGVTRPSNAVIIFAVTPHFSPLLTTLTNDFFQCPAQTRPDPHFTSWQSARCHHEDDKKHITKESTFELWNWFDFCSSQSVSKIQIKLQTLNKLEASA